MGRQLNTSVLYVINEMELSIYRFLTSGAKKNKKVELEKADSDFIVV